MSGGAFEVLACAGLVTIQDGGRRGLLASGLQPGGALDRWALAEGAALLRQDAETSAALEIVGGMIRLRATAATRIALTGAPAKAVCNGVPLVWNASHTIAAGDDLRIGPTAACSYLHVAGGFQTAPILGARAVHLAANIGAAVQAGAALPFDADTGGPVGHCLAPSDRFVGGVIRAVPTPQSSLFTPEQRAALEALNLTKDPRSNRAATRLAGAGAVLRAPGGLSIVSEVATSGDIQVTGDGTPFILMAECQTTGGYPRIATVIPADLPRAAQAPFGAPLKVQMISLETAVSIELADMAAKKALPKRVAPLLRNPADVPDLLIQQLISGAISAQD